ncbi:hypothetical protein Bca52824_034596 [Brassica carinata]|uniref:SAM domain-containing protein n=1 Tax=Brassica carinata TaxID=52824 RepID=A0A8X7V0Z0_BRACI|nr:hypothetical protein Bca52824_034596 [Brassica carinata]
MLSKLGLEEYKKNFKRGHFTDLTLPLLTYSDLQEVNIPSGAKAFDTRPYQEGTLRRGKNYAIKLGLEEYKKNFKRGHFTDLTLPLLTYSDLQEVNIPSGAKAFDTRPYQEGTLRR